MLLFVPVQSCVFSLVCTGADLLLLCVTCKKSSKKEEEEEASLKQARDRSDLVAAAAVAAAGVTRRWHKAPSTRKSLRSSWPHPQYRLQVLLSQGIHKGMGG